VGLLNMTIGGWEVPRIAELALRYLAGDYAQT